MLVVRDDMVHAGAADVDDHHRHGTSLFKRITYAYPHSVRAHIYLCKLGEAIQDAMSPVPVYYTFLPPPVGPGIGEQPPDQLS